MIGGASQSSEIHGTDNFHTGSPFLFIFSTGDRLRKTHIAMENYQLVDHLPIISMVIFHSYVKLPESTWFSILQVILSGNLCKHTMYRWFMMIWVFFKTKIPG